jgi:hypothetical protein
VSNFGPHEWTGGAYDLAAVRRKYEVLRGYCQEIGRPYDAILRTHYTPLLTLAETPAELESKRSRARIPDAGLRTVPVFATVDQAIGHYQGLIDAGVQYFLATVNGRDTQTVELLAGQVMPALRAAGEPARPAGEPAPPAAESARPESPARLSGTYPGPSRPSSS